MIMIIVIMMIIGIMMIIMTVIMIIIMMFSQLKTVWLDSLSFLAIRTIDSYFPLGFVGLPTI